MLHRTKYLTLSTTPLLFVHGACTITITTAGILIVYNLYTQDLLRAREKEGKSFHCVNLDLTYSS